MFQNASNIISVNANNWDLPELTKCSDMFNGATSLTSVNVNNWKFGQTSFIIQYMFYNASSLSTVDFSTWCCAEGLTLSSSNKYRMVYNNAATIAEPNWTNICSD